MREFIEYLLSWVWCSSEDAKSVGLTHHGRLFGIPAWVRDDGEMVVGVPKFPILRLYTDACDWAFSAFSFFVSEDAELVIPLYVGREIE